MKMKTVYCLRIRFSDDEPWREPSFYKRRKDRDYDEVMNRCLGGSRTWRYEETMPAEKAEELAD
jgi:hypothetical protein